jgi:hypothetical protein
MKTNVNNFKKIKSFTKNFQSIILIAIFLPGLVFPYVLSPTGKTVRVENLDPYFGPLEITGQILSDNPKSFSDSKTSDFIKNNLNSPVKSSSLGASGFDFSDALEVTMNDGSGNTLKQGSILGELNASNWYIFYKYALNESGPVELSLTTPTSTEVFQLYFDVFTEEYGYPVGSVFDGNPMLFSYFAQIDGYNYVSISGFDVNFEDTFDIYSGDQVTFNLSVSLRKKGVAPEGALSTLFQSIAYERIDNIMTFFHSNGYIQPGENLDLLKGGILPSDGLDPDDPNFYKGIGLSIYGLVRAGDFISSANHLIGPAKSNELSKYLNIAYQLFDLANNSLNIGIDGTDAVYVAPSDNTRATLTDNAYMLMAIAEIIYLASRDPIIAFDNSTYLANLNDWAYVVAQSIINIFEDTEQGVYTEVVTGLGTSIARENLVYLESMSIVAEAFSELHVIDGSTVNSVPLPATLITEAADIRTKILEHLLITYDTNTTVTLLTGVGIGIGVEYWNKSSDLKSNTSSLMGNLAYALHRTSQFDYVNASLITTNLLRLFTIPGTSLLKQKALIIDDGTILPDYISTLENSEFILLAQRLENKWKEIENNTDASRSWGRKSINTLSSLFDLLYDDVEKAVFGLYDNQAQVLIADDNNINSNRFVANAFINTILVRIFPVQMGVIAGKDNIVGDNAEISLELSQIPQLDSVTWWDFLITFNFQLKIEIPTFSYVSSETVDLADFADFSGNTASSKFITKTYKATQKGNYTIYISLSVEGRDLLSQIIELTALGIVRAEYVESDLIFATDDESFTAKFALIDDNGIAIANLNTNASLGQPFEKATLSTYVKTARSDASGKISIKFDTNKLAQDGIINQSQILNLPKIPTYYFINLYVNVTNADSQNLKQAELVLKIPIKIKLAKFYANFDLSTLQFSTADSEFEGVVTILDGSGVATPNLKLDAALGDPIATSLTKYGEKYITRDKLTDSSGKVTLKFTVSSFEKDKINRTQLSELPVMPSFMIFDLFINITTSSSFNYAGDIIARVKVNLAEINARISPSTLEITQGTSEAFTFSVNALDQDQNPINNATISYSIKNVPGSDNSVFTNVDGEAVITFRDSDLFGLSNLAIAYGGATNTTIIMQITHSSYPTRTLEKTITVLGNKLKITANPVQTNIKQASLFEPKKSVIDVEVATEDSFGKLVTAEVRLNWSNPELNKIFNLDELGTHITPYTFSVDPSALPVGEHNFLIIAKKDGITTTHVVKNPGNITLAKVSSLQSIESTDQIDFFDRPVVLARKIIIEPNTIQDIIISIVGILSGFVIAKGVGIATEKGLILTKQKRHCPHCEEFIGGKQKVCPHCGRDVPVEEKSKKEPKKPDLPKYGSPNEDTARLVEKAGFTDYETYQKAVNLGALTKDDFDKMNKLGAPDFKSIDDIIKGGFPDFKTFAEAKEQGYNTFDDWKTKAQAENIE